MRRNATAVWNGTIKEGKGHLTTQSTTLNQTQYSFNSRFADGVGTNPEELLAAAHAGCFTMKLDAELSQAGYNPEELKTTSVITLDPNIGKITKSELTLTAKVPGISEEEFQAVRNQFENQIVSSNSTVAGIAENLAQNKMYFGNTELINKQMEIYMSITREDIQRVAKKYLTQDNRIILYYLPKAN